MKFLKILAGLLAGLGILGAAFVGLTLWYFNRDLPDYTQLIDYQPPIVTRIQAGDGRLLAEYATEKRVFVPVKAMPPLVINAFLAAEDKNFYTHPGVDILSMIRAGLTDLGRFHSDRRPVGASTITQQVAKNFLLGNEVSIQRKIKEALLALKMEKVLSKDRILELYLNEIYLGGGSYGIAAAALNYFNKSLEDLTVAEAAYLAELPKAPNNYNPDRAPEAAKARRDWVIDRMLEAGFITQQQHDAAQAEPLVTRKRDETEIVKADYFAEEVRRELSTRFGDKMLYEAGLSVRTSLDPKLQAIADHALRDGLIAYDRRHGYRGPIGHIAIESQWAKALAALQAPGGITELGWRQAVVLSVDAGGITIGLDDGTKGRVPFDEMKWARKPLDDAHIGPVPANPAAVLGPGDVVLVEKLAADLPAAKTGVIDSLPLYGLRQVPAVSGAIIALDPHTGRVLAMTGGFSYDSSQFNRATQAKRQTGSAIKPFIYMAALDHGYTPSSIVLDAPLTVNQGDGLPPWTPGNYTHKFYGPLPLRVGIEQSRNLITARLGIAVGLPVVASYVERFGIMDQMPLEYSMLLGAGETSVIRLTTAYAMIVNGGRRIVPSFIDRVQDRNGATIFKADDRPCDGCANVDWSNQAPPEIPDQREQVVDPRTAYQMVHILEGVIDRGTGHVIASLGKPLAGKTGTTNESMDTWFEGFSPDLAVGVFIGFDNPATLGGHETGATVSAPVFKEFMGEALKDIPGIPFRIPPGILLVRVNAETGRLAQPGDRKIIFEAFKPGTEPSGDEQPVAGGIGHVEDEDPEATLPANANSIGADVPVGTGLAPPPAAGLTHTVPASGTGGLY